MNCSYCGRKTDNPPERIENTKLWICDRYKCQETLSNALNKAQEIATSYDDWVTRIPEDY